MKLVTLHKKRYNVPASWNELSRKQLLQAVDVMFLKTYRAEQMILRLLQVIFGLSEHQFLAVGYKDRRLEELMAFDYLVAFLLREDMVFTRNLQPVIECRTVSKLRTLSFYGPGDELMNLRMAEFVFAESKFIQWFSDRDNEALLNELCAILYRPAAPGYDPDKNTEGDAREKFNENVCLFNARVYVQSWPLPVKWAIAWWYHGCRRELARQFPDVLSGSPGEAAKYGLVSVMMNVAEDGLFGKFSEVEDQYVHLVLMHLSETIAKAERMKKSLSK